MRTLPRFRASTLLLAAIAAIVAGPLALGQTDCLQEYRPLGGYSVQVDPNQIALGPADPNGVRRPLLLRVITVTVGMQASDKIRACDPDGDPVVVTCQDGELAAEPGRPEYYRWSWTPRQVGVSYHWIEASDERPATSDALTTRGTIVVVTIPRNRPPVLCGGQP
jgi:hypothetical protein